MYCIPYHILFYFSISLYVYYNRLDKMSQHLNPMCFGQQQVLNFNRFSQKQSNTAIKVMTA